MTRPFRFGVALFTPDGPELLRQAQRAEELGYSTIVLADHFQPQLSPMPALAAIAATTTSIRLGTMVLDNDFRHPAVLAKEAATVDVLSGGRLELGLGAGWAHSDYDMTGIPFDPPGVRVSKLEESVQIIKGLFGEDPVTFAGDHYTITGLTGRPTPVQRPGPPIVIGAGKPRLLRIAAREADIVGVIGTTAAGRMTPEFWRDTSSASHAGKVAVVRDAAGDRFDDIELAGWYFFVDVTPDRSAAAERLGTLVGMTGDEVLDSQSALVGTEDEIIEDLRARRDALGISYLIVLDSEMEMFAPIVAKLTGS